MKQIMVEQRRFLSLCIQMKTRPGLCFIKVRNIPEIKVPKLLRNDSSEIIPFFKYLGINQK